MHVCTDGLEGAYQNPECANYLSPGINMHYKFEAFEWRSVPGTCLGEGGEMKEEMREELREEMRKEMREKMREGNERGNER